MDKLTMNELQEQLHKITVILQRILNQVKKYEILTMLAALTCIS